MAQNGLGGTNPWGGWGRGHRGGPGRCGRSWRRWKHSGLTLREFGQERGIAVSTLSWWRRVFRHAGAEEGNSPAAENAVVFTEVPPPAKLSRTPAVVEIVLRSGHLVRVPGGADRETLQRVLQALQTTC
jgi:hypothetical protein